MSDKSQQRARPKPSPDVKLSKALSYILRHGAEKEGLAVTPDGYVKVDDLLKKPKFQNVDISTIKRIVDNNDKQRFKLLQETDPSTNVTTLYIRANQGHSIKVEDDGLLQEITSHEQIPVVVHGTLKRNWTAISKEGLKAMTRKHIHFASGLYGEDGVISGMRKTSDLFIYIDSKKAMNDGIKFYRSENGVILTSGKDGLLSPDYFSKVVRNNE